MNNCYKFNRMICDDKELIESLAFRLHEEMNVRSLRRLGGDGEGEGARSRSMRGPRQKEKSYLNRKQQDDRLTRQVCCNAIERSPADHVDQHT